MTMWCDEEFMQNILMLEFKYTLIGDLTPPPPPL